jgi:hypothetical protein
MSESLPSAAYREQTSHSAFLAVHLEYPLYGFYQWQEGDEKIVVVVAKEGRPLPEPLVGQYGAYTPKLFLLVPKEVRALPLDDARLWVRRTMEKDAQERYGIVHWMTERI